MVKLRCTASIVCYLLSLVLILQLISAASANKTDPSYYPNHRNASETDQRLRRLVEFDDDEFALDAHRNASFAKRGGENELAGSANASSVSDELATDQGSRAIYSSLLKILQLMKQQIDGDTHQSTLSKKRLIASVADKSPHDNDIWSLDSFFSSGSSNQAINATQQPAISEIAVYSEPAANHTKPSQTYTDGVSNGLPTLVYSPRIESYLPRGGSAAALSSSPSQASRSWRMMPANWADRYSALPRLTVRASSQLASQSSAKSLSYATKNKQNRNDEQDKSILIGTDEVAAAEKLQLQQQQQQQQQPQQLDKQQVLFGQTNFIDSAPTVSAYNAPQPSFEPLTGTNGASSAIDSTAAYMPSASMTSMASQEPQQIKSSRPKYSPQYQALMSNNDLSEFSDAETRRPQRRPLVSYASPGRKQAQVNQKQYMTRGYSPPADNTMSSASRAKYVTRHLIEHSGISGGSQTGPIQVPSGSFESTQDGAEDAVPVEHTVSRPQRSKPYVALATPPPGFVPAGDSAEPSGSATSPTRTSLNHHAIHLQQVYPSSQVGDAQQMQQQQHNVYAQQQPQQQQQPMPQQQQVVYSLATAPGGLKGYLSGKTGYTTSAHITSSGTTLANPSAPASIYQDPMSSSGNTQNAQQAGSATMYSAATMSRDLVNQPGTIQITTVPNGYGYGGQPIIRVNGATATGGGGWFGGYGGGGGGGFGNGGFMDPFGRQILMVNAERRQIDWSFWIWPLIALVTLPLVLGALFVPLFLKTIIILIQLLQSLGLLLPIANAMGSLTDLGAASGNNAVVDTAAKT